MCRQDSVLGRDDDAGHGKAMASSIHDPISVEQGARALVKATIWVVPGQVVA